MDHVLTVKLSAPHIVDFIERQFPMSEGSPENAELMDLAREVATIATPKALYKIASIDSKGENHVIINGIKFTSYVLRINLDNAHRVFPFVATCGTELEDWSRAITDEKKKSWTSLVKEMAVSSILGKLNDHLHEHYRPGDTSVMNPGSLKEWPLEEQRPLFTLLGNVEEQIGIRLLETGMMLPDRTVSGIRFPSREKFENCMLCPIEDCPIRRCPYDKHLHSRKYRMHK